MLGVVMAEKQEPYSEDERRTFDVVGKFNGFTKWYLGSQFASGNSMDKACLTWTSKLAHAIHKPVEIDQD
uniref:Uncharacterized protein n=1 Tax=Ciona savignyi TaxID=51511 RepID=H2YKY9_CIOSA